MHRFSQFHAGNFSRCLAVAGLAALPAAADPKPHPDVRPAAADLRDHLACAQEAARRVLGFDEARVCATAYMRVKLAFVPGLELDDFERLPPEDRAAINRLAYARYVAWRAANPAETAAIADAPSPHSTFASR